MAKKLTAPKVKELLQAKTISRLRPCETISFAELRERDSANAEYVAYKGIPDDEQIVVWRAGGLNHACPLNSFQRMPRTGDANIGVYATSISTADVLVIDEIDGEYCTRVASITW